MIKDIVIKKIKYPAVIIAYSFVVLLLSACGDKDSPETQVRQFLSEVVVAAESRDVLAIRSSVSDQYGDANGRDKRALVGLTTGYFLRHKNIHLFTRINKITFPDKAQAQVEMVIAMVGSPVTGAQALLDLRSDLYQFNLVLKRDGDNWQLQNAKWERTSADKLLE